jgi:hypothetical protein
MLTTDQHWGMSLVWSAYFSILELLSLGQTSEVSPCIVVSQEQGAKDQSGYQACAAVHEAVSSLLGLIYRHASHDNVIAFGTAVIALFTFTLWRSTNNLWKAADRDFKAAQIKDRRASLVRMRDDVQVRKQMEIAAKAANAATKSAEAALAAERARFFIMIENTNISDVLYAFKAEPDPTILTLVGTTTPPEITYRIKNYGKTPGIILEVSLGMKVASERAIPVYSGVLNCFPEYMIAAGGSTEQTSFTMDRSLTSAEADGIHRNTQRIWFWGRIDYRDVFGMPQVHRFYFRSVVLTGSDCILQPDDFEYYNQST